MSFTENLYLKRMIQKLQEENNQLSNLVEYYQEYQQGGGMGMGPGMGPGMGSGMGGDVGTTDPTTFYPQLTPQLDYFVGVPRTTIPATTTSSTGRSRKPRLGPTSGGVSPVSGNDIQSSPTQQSTPSGQGPRRPAPQYRIGGSGGGSGGGSSSSQQGQGGPQGGGRGRDHRHSSKPTQGSSVGKLGPRKTSRGRNPRQGWWDRMFG